MMLAVAIALLLVRLALRLLGLPGEPTHAHAAPSATTPPTSLYAAIAIWITVPLLCMTWLAAVLGGDLGALPPLLGGVVLLMPWTLASRIAAPLGLWRTAWALTRLSAWVWRGDTAGGAVVAGALALAHRPGRPNTKAIAFLVRRRDAATPLRGGAILATALLAEIRDDRETMLQLTRSVLLLVEDPRHCGARGLAAQWLAAQAAAQGRWKDVLALTGRVRSLPAAARLLRGVAYGRVHGAAGWLPRLRLLAAWLGAPQRGRTWRFVRDTLGRNAAGEQPAPSEPSDDTRPSSTDPRATLARHARLTAIDPTRVTPQQLASAALAWERTLASATLRQTMASRADAVGARRGDPLATTRAQVTDELATLLADSGMSTASLHDAPLLLAAAVSTVESRATAEVEARLAPLARRRHDDSSALAPIDAWREFVHLREAYELAVRIRGDVGRRLLFDDTDTEVSNLGARLWNQRHERSIANAMFAWLLPEARAIGDEEAIARLNRNLRSGL